ncbi:T9SS type A sorting domain-containing protein, partial [candidate division KSB1 bacterium]|nr:T9SS type A sorting domain-containing protein [candidate division KSB1 bacterium]
NPSTVINYTIPQSLNSPQVKLEIFNLLGQKVITLVDAKQVAGEHSIQWNGKNEAGNLVSSGVYLYRLKAENFVEMRKMMFIR